MSPKNACLIVIDGWGIAPQNEAKGDAIGNAKTPVMDGFRDGTDNAKWTTLDAHGLAVGLPDGLMGNSEVGHLNIGAGRVVYQDIVRIDLSVKNNSLKSQPALVNAFKRATDGNGRLHLLGLVSDGGVHAHIDHLVCLVKAAKEYGIPHTFIHFFGDGRDTAPKSAAGYMQDLQDELKKLNYGEVATVVGRYYAMDRDKRWERVQIAIDGLVSGEGEHADDPVAAIKKRYESNETDEFLKPIIFGKDGRINDNDTLVCFNFRSDRMRELSQSLGMETPCKPKKKPQNLSITTMTQYKADFPFPTIFPPQKMTNVLAEWLSAKGVKQCHIAETEKYAHVTFFFNGGTETQYKQEDRDLIASPRVATYDKQPEMSAEGVAEKVAERVRSKEHPFVMCNFAPPDMVGHTGVYDAAVLGVEATDKAIGVIWKACQEAGYALFVTADHGNAEKMLSEDGQPHTAHTTNQVPFVMANAGDNKFSGGGALADVAPTILAYMDIEKPEEMSGNSLL